MITLQPTDPHEGALRDLAPDMTPMLDIMFILLVFFMLTAGVALQSLDLKLPGSVSEELPALDAPNHVLLQIRKDDYVLDGAPVASLAALETKVPAALAARPGHELVIAGDKRISIERLLQVLTTLQAQNIEAANILMQKGDDQ